MPDDAVIERLDLMLGVLHLAHDEAIETARRRLRADPVNAAILDVATGEEWIRSADLQRRVSAVEPTATKRTIQRRVSELVARRALNERGAGKTQSYRATGLI
jgi:prophage DNA circulation protein